MGPEDTCVDTSAGQPPLNHRDISARSRPATILVIEADGSTIQNLRLAFKVRRPEFELVCANLGAEAPALLQKHAPDVVILDSCLPDMDGLQVLKEIRCRSSIPVIMLSEKPSKADMLTAMEGGANDCIARSCRQLELLARVQAQLGRTV